MRTRKILAGVLAAILLVGALVYYNFIDKAPVSGAEKGNRCPDFTAQTYAVEDDSFATGEESFTLSQQIGKVCIVNFWETWCQACIEELPSFNRIRLRCKVGATVSLFRTRHGRFVYKVIIYQRAYQKDCRQNTC
jgi:hypothetical protein